MGEALSFLGDDAGVLDVVRRARADLAASGKWEGYRAALLAYLAAAAAYRQGKEAQARKFWEQSLAHDPDFEGSRNNLADLNRPIGERHAGWAYTLAHWLPQRT